MSSDNYTVGVIENNYFDEYDLSICLVCKNRLNPIDLFAHDICSDCGIIDYETKPELSRYYQRHCANYVYGCKDFVLDKDTYNLYLQSKKWKAFAKEQKIKAGLKCELCGSPFNLELHHLNYENILFETELDVVCLCHNCHAKIHDKEVEG